MSYLLTILSSANKENDFFERLPKRIFLDPKILVLDQKNPLFFNISYIYKLVSMVRPQSPSLSSYKLIASALLFPNLLKNPKLNSMITESYAFEGVW
jgi:hypothetical protein